MCMGNKCMVVGGILTALAGLAFLLGAVGVAINATTGSMAGGVMLLASGLGGLMHGMGMCGTCKEMCVCEESKPGSKRK